MFEKRVIFVYLCAYLCNFSFYSSSKSVPINPTWKTSNHLSPLESKQSNGFDAVKRSLRLLQRGTVELYSYFRKSSKLDKIKKEKGIHALSFSEFQFLKQSKDDMSKMLRVMFTLPLSPEFFFYSYIVFPMMSPGNPWAWRSFPSTFDDEDLAKARENSLIKRRIQAVVSSLQQLKSEAIDDVPESTRFQREKQLRTIERAISKHYIRDSLKELSEFIVQFDAKKSQKKKQPEKANLAAIPGSVIKECCRCFGVDGLPNIPLIRRFNNGEVQRCLERLRDSDDFLRVKGVAELSSEEARMACNERFIGVERKSLFQMRSDLHQWLTLAYEPIVDSSVSSSHQGGSSRTNFQNQRLALLALHAVKSLKTSDFARTYRTLLH